ncbi:MULTISPECIES: serine/threonine-protein kinase [Streptomyces]|uniref:non-specific serine/threonine protein kinase n=1 Tax=Streptomyces albus (strain ATCC 21838 / DSM 41398 / FERM P-419 / JCM 4703 / NBRC 107858) TaxID=1081613 RepID=A0A0B5F2B8_STRA4|nr:serine/threonine-protein kinase [Streptomyces sp. SCSIO ZS0520]AJE85031.1 serine/threonine protein kinase [Streptomyces albus]AOU79337.1 serine/threonine protein kinase [Streptomyces albus]
MQGLLLGGRYRLGETIGRGGMGRVWRAQDELLHRAVAVKELTAAQYVQDSDRSVLLARTQTEARAAARINHPAVVTVHDVLEHDDRPWIVMELVEGTSLADTVKQDGGVEARRAARIGLWVLRALRAAHAAGVLHRDVKPGNVLLADDGRVLLTDFGIAQVEGDSTLTRTGEIVGSVDYLAPERVRGAEPGPSADLWALGATLYTAVEGVSPFRRTTPLNTMQAVVDEEPAPPARAEALGPVITALLRKDPRHRPGPAEAEQLLAEVARGGSPEVTLPQVPPQPGPERRESATLPGPDPHPYEHTPSYGRPYPPGEPQRYGGSGPAPAPAPRGRARRRILAVVLAAALVGGGTAAGVHLWNQRQDDSRGASPGATGSAETPEGWERVHDPEGFSLSLPRGWKREVNEGQIDYTPDGGEHFVRISRDTSPDYDDVRLHQLALEKSVEKLTAYRRLQMEPNVYRDRKGSLWEFTWTAGASGEHPGPRRAIEQTYVSAEGVEYALYLSSPEKDWAEARKQFGSILRSWRE